MLTRAFADHWWSSTLRLAERATILSNSDGIHSTDKDAVERRFRRWTLTPAFNFPENMLHFLSSQGLDEKSFRTILSLPASSSGYPNNSPPHWASEFANVMVEQDVRSKSSGSVLDALGFLGIVEPFINESVAELRDFVRQLNNDYPNAIDETTVIECLSDALKTQVLGLVTRPLVLELNVARIEGAGTNTTSEERLEGFRQRIASPSGRQEVFIQYPVLARQCWLLFQQWLATNKEFLSRVCHDAVLLSRTFGYSAIGSLLNAQITSDDAHQQGRRVIIADFESGLRVVYKPRPQITDAGFQAFLSWLNIRGQSPTLRTLAILDCGTYGWCEFVQQAGCVSAEEVQRFYRRHGALLAILYCLGGTDAHFQNIVAAGEDPVYIDVETLFQPRLVHSISSEDADQIARNELADSVLSVGLLPEPIITIDGIVDFSGLGATPFTTTALKTIHLDRFDNDDVRMSRVGFRIEETHNRATLNGIVASTAAYSSDLEAGFCHTYNILREYKTALLSIGGPIDIFRHAPIRVVVRPTATYSALLADSLHPQALCDSIERERILSQLWWPIASQPVIKSVVHSEYEQLLDGDIPYFFTTPASVDLTSGTGETIRGVLPTCGLQRAENRMQRLSDLDMDRQRWLVRASVASLDESSPATSARNRIKEPQCEKLASYLDVATAIGERLAQTAIRSGDLISWLSFNPMITDRPYPITRYTVGLIESNLYDGLAGIAFYVSYLAALTSHMPFVDLSQRILDSLRIRLPEIIATEAIGTFEGVGGLVYLYSHIGVLYNDDSMLTKAMALLPAIGNRVTSESRLDIIGGSAGCILALLSLYNCRRHSQPLEIAISCGDHLLEKLTPEANASISKSHTLQYHRGFSHGLAGIAWALSQLWAATGETRFRDAAAEMCGTERILLAGECWTDGTDPLLIGQASWCHGAPGIALSRLAMYRSTRRKELRFDAEQALQRTSESFDLGNHSLCHGNLGNLEPLSLAADIFGDMPTWSLLAKERASIILADILKHGWRSARPNSVEVPGLMTGIAGIGYGMLRLAEPSKTPSILLLEPPRINSFS